MQEKENIYINPWNKVIYILYEFCLEEDIVSTKLSLFLNSWPELSLEPTESLKLFNSFDNWINLLFISPLILKKFFHGLNNIIILWWNLCHYSF